MIEIIVATQNRHKFSEIKKILKALPIKLIPLYGYKNFPDVVEDKKTLRGNASKKARTIAKYFDKWALSDDTGLGVDHLNGRPGVFSARFAGPGCTYADNNKKLQRLLGKTKNRKAAFTAVIALSDPRGRVVTVEGKIRGEIADHAMGENGFGYDPFFLVLEYNKTFAQMSDKLKNKISHRALALEKAKILLKKLLKS